MISLHLNFIKHNCSLCSNEILCTDHEYYSQLCILHCNLDTQYKSNKFTTTFHLSV